MDFGEFVEIGDSWVVFKQIASSVMCSSVMDFFRVFSTKNYTTTQPQNTILWLGCGVVFCSVPC